MSASPIHPIPGVRLIQSDQGRGVHSLTPICRVMRTDCSLACPGRATFEALLEEAKAKLKIKIKTKTKTKRKGGRK